MAVLFKSFVQPSSGGSIEIVALGDPGLCLDEKVTFFGHGDYQVVKTSFDDPPPEGQAKYGLQLMKRVAGRTTVPAGTPITTYVHGVTVSNAPASSGVVAISFIEGDYQLLDLAGNITFNTQHHGPGKSVAVRIKNTSTTVSRTLTFSAQWTFLGVKPSSILPNKTGVLSITCLGYSDLDIIAVWAVQD